MYTARYPRRVRRLVLYGASGLPDLAPAPQIRERGAALAALRRADIELYVRAEVMRFFPSGTDEETVRSLMRVIRMAATPEMQDQLEATRFGVGSVLGKVT